MTSGRVLVIDGDEWTSQLLITGLMEKGYTVDYCTNAMPGFRKACETIPDCIVLTQDLPDLDGAWVVRRVRTEVGPVAKVPILFLGDDATLRAQILNVGADFFLLRPIEEAEVIATLNALVSMARRLMGSTSSTEGAVSSMGAAAAIRGDLSAFPLASMLMMFEMERRSGLIEVTSGSGKKASIVMNSGLFASTEIGGQPRPALQCLREVLSWRAGRFSFATKESDSLPPARASIGALVLEAMRLEDEEKEAAEELSVDDVIEEPPSVRPTRGGASRPQTGS